MNSFQFFEILATIVFRVMRALGHRLREVAILATL